MGLSGTEDLDLLTLHRGPTELYTEGGLITWSQPLICGRVPGRGPLCKKLGEFRVPWRLRLEVCVWKPVLSCAGLSGTVGRGGSTHHIWGCREGGRQVWGLLERGCSGEASEPASLSLHLYLCSGPLWTAFVQTL